MLIIDNIMHAMTMTMLSLTIAIESSFNCIAIFNMRLWLCIDLLPTMVYAFSFCFDMPYAMPMAVLLAVDDDAYG